jgi:hypothetical protein
MGLGPPIGRELDRKVLKLQPGMSIETVKSRLGMPEGYEEVFEDSSNPEEILWYGSWKLSFIDGGLESRNKS